MKAAEIYNLTYDYKAAKGKERELILKRMIQVSIEADVTYYFYNQGDVTHSSQTALHLFEPTNKLFIVVNGQIILKGDFDTIKMVLLVMGIT